MRDVAFDIATYIGQRLSSSLTLGTNLFVGFEPVSPDNCVTVYSTMSDGSEYTLEGAVLEKNRVQVRVRNIKPFDGLSLMSSIADLFDPGTKITVNNNTYQLVLKVGRIYNIGVDERMRTVFVLNLDVIV